jgi:hypothetical protein
VFRENIFLAFGKSFACGDYKLAVEFFGALVILVCVSFFGLFLIFLFFYFDG